MVTTPLSKSWSRSAAEICFLISGAIALFVILSWIFGFWRIGAVGENYVPMAPSTAILMLVLSCAAFLNIQCPHAKFSVYIIYSGVFLLIFVSLFLWLQNRYYPFYSFEDWLAREPNMMSGIPMGRMAPLTAQTFIMAALSVLLQRPQIRKKLLAIVSGVVVFIIGATILAGYTAGVPLYYDTSTIPMAFFTSIAFIFIGAGLTINAVSSSELFHIRDEFPITSVGSSPKFPRSVIAIYVIFVIAVCVVGWFYLKRQQTQMRSTIQNELSAVADLKVQQIVNWRKERMNDARFFFNASFVKRDVQALIGDPSSESKKAEIINWMTLVKGNDRYDQVALYDAQIKELISISSVEEKPTSIECKYLKSALRSDEIMFTDLHGDNAKGDIHLSVIFPVFSPNNPSTAPIGVVKFQINPYRFLYPLIQSWPGESKTAETLLVRREDDNVLFLNELRHRQNTALTLMLPIDPQKRLPAAMAVLGQEGIVEGNDYRGVPVLASVRKVPDSPWFFVAKIDQDEIFAPLRRRAIATGLVVIALILISGLGLTVMWRRRDAIWLREKLKSELERKALSDRLEHLLRDANDIILITDITGKILEFNNRAVETYGYSSEELLQMNIAALREPETRGEVPQRIEKLLADGRAFYETVQCRKNGTLFPVEVSGRAVEIGGEKYTLAIIRNITQRKEHEKEIERLNRLYATLSHINEVLVRVTSAKQLFDQVCRIIVEFGGLRIAFIGLRDPYSKMVTILAEYGEDLNYLQQFQLYYDDRPEGQGPTGIAIRENKMIVFNDFLSDPKSAPWRKMAIEKGIRAVAALPIRMNGEIYGVLTIYAAEKGYFGAQEINLLEEAAADISFALDHLEQEKRRLRAEDALRKEKETAERYLEIAGVGFVAISRDGKVILANRKMCEILGSREDEIIGKNWFDNFLPEEMRPQVKNVFSQIMKGDMEQTEYYENPVLTASGGTRIIAWRNTILKDEEGKITGTLSSGEDVTERKNAEEAARRQQERVDHLNRVLRAIRDVNQLIVHEKDKGTLIKKTCEILVEHRGFGCAMIILTDAAGKPSTYAESGMGKLFAPLAGKIMAGSLPGCCVAAREAEEMVHITEQNDVCADCPLSESCSQKQAMCVRLQHDDRIYGYLAVSLDRVIVIDEEEKSLLREMAGDVSFALHGMGMEKDMRKAREEKEITLAQFLQAQKMEAVGRLAGGVAHDFNNMLSVILGYSETALKELSPDDPLYEDLKEIKEAAERSANLTRQLLAFSRRQAIAPKALNINEAIRNMERMLQRIIGEDISLSLKLESDLWNVKLDPSQIDQIVANLAVNSRDAMPDGGKLIIETKNEVFDDDYLTAHVGFAAGEYVMLAISDAGAGMDEETLEHIFEPFFTTKSADRGTGLGLSTVYGIAKQNNGFVNVYSELGMGTTIKIYLPRHEGAPDKERVARVTNDVLSGDETILLVEDEEQLRRLVKSILEELGYNVLEANGAGDALIMCERYKGAIHLLLTDVVMPNLNGKELRDRIIKIKPAIKTLFMSGYTADVIAYRGVLEQGIHFLSKPFTRETLARKMREALAEQIAE